MSSKDRESIDLNLSMNRMGQTIRDSGLLAAGAFVTCVALAAFASTQLTPKYTADSQLLFTKIDRTAVLTGFGAGAGDAGQLQSLLNDQTPLSTQMQVLQSRPLLQQTIDILELKDDDGKPLSPEAIAPNLDMNILGGTDIIEVAFTHPDPDVAASVVNTLIEQYREQSIQTNREEAREAKDFLLAQLPQTEVIVRQAEADLRNFLERNQIGVLDEEASSLVTRLENLSREIATVQSTLEGTARQVQSLQGKLRLNPQEALTVGALSQNPGVQEAILALQAVERDLAVQEARFSPSSPVVRQLRAQQESLASFLSEQVVQAGGAPRVPDSLLQGTPGQVNITQTLIQDYLNAEVQYTGLQQQLTVLKAYEQEYQERLKTVPSLSAEQRALERRVAVAEETYSALLTRLQELQVQENETTYNTRIIQSAVPPLEPDSGAKLQVLALGVLGGALVAITIVLATQILSTPVPRRPALGSEESAKARPML
ncbi:MAG: GumC family protein [Spirulina sp.]